MSARMDAFEMAEGDIAGCCDILLIARYGPRMPLSAALRLSCAKHEKLMARRRYPLLSRKRFQPLRRAAPATTN